jgi:hypothetical protein
MSQAEATDAIMATIGEYDALWDGELFPEIIDAEYYDCFDRDHGVTVDFPEEMIIYYDVQLRDFCDHHEALDTVITTITAMVENSLDAPIFSEDIDGMLYDHPVRIDEYDDPPSIRSLK